MDESIKYDIIFIDGSYEYEDVKEDLINCKLYSHENTILILNNSINYKNYIKYWNKGPTKIWKEKKNEGFITELEQIDIKVGKGTSIGKYN